MVKPRRRNRTLTVRSRIHSADSSDSKNHHGGHSDARELLLDSLDEISTEQQVLKRFALGEKKKSSSAIPQIVVSVDSNRTNESEPEVDSSSPGVNTPQPPPPATRTEGMAENPMKQLLSEQLSSPQRNSHRMLKAVAVAQAENATTIKLSGLKLDAFPLVLLEEGKFAQLTRIDLSYNKLSILPISFQSLPNVESFNMSHNELDVFPQGLCSLKALKTLDLSYNQLSRIPSTIQSLSSLQSLSFSHNRVESLPVEIGLLAMLTNLQLESNKLSTLAEEIGSCILLESLSVRKNVLEELPSAVGHLIRLQSLNVSGNKLRSLPPSCCQLIHLRQLHCSANMLTSLPEPLSYLSELEFLDLSENQLTVLPSTLSLLKSLRTLAVGGNPLSYPPPNILRSGTARILKFLNVDERMDDPDDSAGPVTDDEGEFISPIQPSIRTPYFDMESSTPADALADAEASSRSESLFSSRLGVDDPVNEVSRLRVSMLQSVERHSHVAINSSLLEMENEVARLKQALVKQHEQHMREMESLRYAKIDAVEAIREKNESSATKLQSSNDLAEHLSSSVILSQRLLLSQIEDYKSREIILTARIRRSDQTAGMLLLILQKRWSADRLRRTLRSWQEATVCSRLQRLRADALAYSRGRRELQSVWNHWREVRMLRARSIHRHAPALLRWHHFQLWRAFLAWRTNAANQQRRLQLLSWSLNRWIASDHLAAAFITWKEHTDILRASKTLAASVQRRQLWESWKEWRAGCSLQQRVREMQKSADAFRLRKLRCNAWRWWKESTCPSVPVGRQLQLRHRSRFMRETFRKWHMALEVQHRAVRVVTMVETLRNSRLRQEVFVGWRAWANYCTLMRQQSDRQFGERQQSLLYEYFGRWSEWLAEKKRRKEKRELLKAVDILRQEVVQTKKCMIALEEKNSELSLLAGIAEVEETNRGLSSMS